MKCFIHLDKEAIAACRNCGKGMCADCSSYSGHSGICPACRNEEYKKELRSLQMEDEGWEWDRAKSIIAAVLLCWTIVGAFVYGIRAKEKLANHEQRVARMNYLKREIAKLDKAMAKGTGVI